MQNAYEGVINLKTRVWSNSKFIRDKILGSKLTLDEVANMAKITKATLSRILNRPTSLNYGTAQRLISCFGQDAILSKYDDVIYNQVRLSVAKENNKYSLIAKLGLDNYKVFYTQFETQKSLSRAMDFVTEIFSEGYEKISVTATFTEKGYSVVVKRDDETLLLDSLLKGEAEKFAEFLNELILANNNYEREIYLRNKPSEIGIETSSDLLKATLKKADEVLDKAKAVVAETKNETFWINLKKKDCDTNA